MCLSVKTNNWIISGTCKRLKCLSVSGRKSLLVSCSFASTCYCLPLETSVKQETFTVFCKLLLKHCQVTLLWKICLFLWEKKRADPGTWSPVGRKWKSNLENYRSNCCQKEASKLSVLFFHFSLLCFPLDLAANQTPSVTVVMLA